jgi:hypothetical protein
MSEAEELLAGARTLRRRARTDRHAYWLPLLFFGLATAAAAPLYVITIEVPDDGGALSLYAVRTDPRIGSYWTVALLAGALLSVWWYRRRGNRVGIEGRVGPALVAAAVFLIGYAVLGMLPSAADFLWPLWVRDFAALLVVAVGLLALAWEERSPGLGIVAAVFTATAVVANTYDLSNLVYQIGWDVPFRVHQLPNLLVPAAVLLAGGLVAGLRAWRSR